MNNTEIIPTAIFSKTIKGLGDIHLRFLDIEKDIKTIHDWVTKPYAMYWGMQEYTLEEVKLSYQQIVESDHHDAFIGILDNQPIFLMESYDALKDPISAYYNTEKKDRGMHILVSPVKKKIPNFTWHVFSTILEYLFSDPQTDRIVVEPDVRNEKIHSLNKRAGFKYYKEVELPHKTAALAFCDKKDYEKALLLEEEKNIVHKTKTND
ncbi:RimJ/RimL family protein N-acetyltransferase [Aquimarina sp. MAR_2010_214]|uniref:GNAT family N-acetyltransferase n=1 Tax=Aquimarina sp. MAR_2010_214 TaxID=1250026 RepID=UPI000CA7A5B2|nr:GNAT family N-acetyltransferase [Aquimarina sp. MAR_2010_214]PKV53045.1 RimJ/RimL family protein N-acetyltransferase [Aquimarina sp. MAR_2010_214]